MAAVAEKFGAEGFKVAPEGIYVGEIMLAGTIKGPPFDRGQPSIEGKTVADKYWELYTARKDLRTTLK